jgi:hypothetical protein
MKVITMNAILIQDVLLSLFIMKLQSPQYAIALEKE